MSRRKKSKRLFRSRPSVAPDYGRLFHQALTDVRAEDRADRMAAIDALAKMAYGEELSGFDVHLVALECLLDPSPWPCAGCGGDCGQMASWAPNRESLGRDFGCPPHAAAI